MLRLMGGGVALSWLACHASRAARSSSAVRPVIGPPAVRTQDKVSRAVSESVRTIKPESRAGEVSRVLNPANSGSGSHSGSERGPDQGLMSWLSRKARSIQVNVQEVNAQDERSASAHSAKNWPRMYDGPIPSKYPVRRVCAACTIHRARSRTSMSWTASSGVPGTSTSPPRSSRVGQEAQRPVRSSRTCSFSGPADKGVLHLPPAHTRPWRRHSSPRYCARSPVLWAHAVERHPPAARSCGCRHIRSPSIQRSNARRAA